MIHSSFAASEACFVPCSSQPRKRNEFQLRVDQSPSFREHWSVCSLANAYSRLMSVFSVCVRSHEYATNSVCAVTAASRPTMPLWDVVQRNARGD